MSEKITMELMNPRGKIEVTPATSLSPRLESLDGKTIGLYSNGKPGMDNFYAVFEEILKEKYPSVKTVKFSGAFLIRDEDAEALAKQADAFVYGVGD
jgi:hypothetical protein